MAGTGIGYYDLQLGTGNPDQLDEIVDIGHEANAVNVTTLSPALLATLKVLVIQNPDNTSYSAAFLEALPDIRAAVANGLTVIIHDRAPQLAAGIFPEGSGLEFVRELSEVSGAQMQLGSSGNLIASTPFGTVTDTSVDGYDFSNHGYVQLSSLPPGALVLMTTNDPTHVTAFVYPLGAGKIIYTSSPVDFWGDSVAGSSAEIVGFDTTGMEAFARNILFYAAGAVEEGVTATDDTAAVSEGVATIIDVLGNDSGNTLRVVAIDGVAIAAGQTVTLASGSTVKLNADGTLTYTSGGTSNNANLGQEAAETFNYTLANGTGQKAQTDIGAVAVTISGDYTRIDGTNKSETLNGTAFDDTINGKAGADILYGNAGNDILNGGGGGQVDGDRMFGGIGDDTYYVDSTRDLVGENLEEGHDKVISSISAYTLTANVEDLELASGALTGTGNSLDNSMVGNAAANTLNGVGGNDQLDGQGGNDALYGGAGGDALFGGAGADTFIYKAASDSQASVSRPPVGAQAAPELGVGANTDVIYDFNVGEGDKIDLTAIDASTKTAGNNDFVVVNAFTKVAGQMTVKTFGDFNMTSEDGAPLNVERSIGYILEGDTNGDGQADFTLMFNATASLTVNDLKASILGISAWNFTNLGTHASAPSAIQTTIPDLFH